MSKVAANDTTALESNCCRHHILRTRVRDPTKSDFGLHNFEDDGTVVLKLGNYTGEAEISALVEGVLYDAENMTCDANNAENGTFIIKTEE